MSDVRGLFNVIPTYRGSPEVEALPEAERPLNLRFWCPACRETHGVNVGSPLGGGIRWGFNGDFDKPVLSPSLLVMANRWEPPVTLENIERWKREPWTQTQRPLVCHSFVGCNGAQPGQIIFLSDCTHALAGQTVDLPAYPQRHGA